MEPPTAAFEMLGPAEPESPVVLSVPHAGRIYPLALRANLRVPPATLIALEDRYVDHVAAGARGKETMLVQQLARSWIDLNRGEEERDPLVEEGAAGAPGSARLRSGLGLVPRRTSSTGDLWRRRFTREDIDRRIEREHRPYHQALSTLLAKARERFGVAVLIDVHSMPSLAGRKAAEIVIGDRFGATAPPRIVDRVRMELEAAGWRHAVNAPYAGGYIITRHARPAENLHALQIEFDRARYLDASGDQPGVGAAAASALLRRLIDAVRAAALDTERAQAAE